MTHCAHCGATLTPGARSCAACGSHPALSDPPAAGEMCRICAAPLARSWRHCVTCGVATQDGEASRLVRTSIDAEARMPPEHQIGFGDIAEADDVAEDRWPAELHP